MKSPIYRSLESRWSRGVPTVLDGGIGSELQALGYPGDHPGRPVNFTWGALALYDDPAVVKTMHRCYVDAGADILLTNTFLFHRCVRMERDGDLDVPLGTWKEKARLAVRLARQAATEAGRPDVAVGFAMMIQDSPKAEWAQNGPSTGKVTRDWSELVSTDYLQELAEALDGDPPDAFVVELAPPIEQELAFVRYGSLVATGVPLWVAFRRGVGGPVGILGDQRAPDGDRFGLAARRLEEMGAGAILVHCLPPSRAHGVAPWLRQFTSLPLGVYPNNGQYDQWLWEWRETITPAELADHARLLAGEGMRIIGGCCGVRPEHIRAVARALKSNGPSGVP